MKVIYPNINKIVCTERLPNNLVVRLIPEINYDRTVGMITVRSGSLDCPVGLSHDLLPYGLAHFLEHVLFCRKNDNYFNTFLKLGATTNAFTSYSSTSFMFSTYLDPLPCINTLLNLLLLPEFSLNDIEVEKKIIKQEILMYKGQQEEILRTKLLNKLFPETPFGTDICGTLSSIQKIDRDLLYRFHNEFYVINNMTLTLIGNFELEYIQDGIQYLSLLGKKKTEYGKMFKAIKNSIGYEESTIDGSGVISIGVRGDSIYSNFSIFTLKIALELLLELVFGDLSKYTEKWKKENLISTTIDYSITVEKGYQFLMLTVTSKHRKKLFHEILDILLGINKAIVYNMDTLEVVKKKLIGEKLSLINSLDNQLLEFTKYTTDEDDYFSFFYKLEGIHVSDLILIALNFITNAGISVYSY